MSAAASANPTPRPSSPHADGDGDGDGGLVAQPWATPVDDVLAELDVTIADGLTAEEARARLERYGPNEVAQQSGRSLWAVALDQFLSPIVYILVAAGVAALLAGEVVEAIAVLIAVVINAVIGFVTEVRAKQSVDSLRELGRTTATVRRGGSLTTVDGADLVPGDVVELEEGDVIPADLRLVEAAGLQVDEAPLTGESEPVRKAIDPVDAATPLAERLSMAFKGTRVSVGTGEGVVVATGAATQIGEVSTLVGDAGGDGDTPLEERLDALGKALIGAVIVVGIVVAAGGIAVGQPVQEMVEVAIALAVAAVPEGLAVVATLALARGVVRMARHNALVKRLASVETLGSAGVVFTDKTGTLTEGRMEATILLLGTDERVDLDAGDLPDQALAALLVGSLCGNAELGQVDVDDDEDVGDPMELALQRAAVDADLGTREDLLSRAPEVAEVAFDRDTRMMATFHELPADRGDAWPEGDGLLVAVKGAPGALLEVCTRSGDGTALDEDGRQAWLDAQTDLAGEGVRVLGLARKVASSQDEDPYADLELLGMVGLLDPPRAATKDAIAACHRAGVEVVMVTGDQVATARAIARQIGLVDPDDDEVAVLRGSDIPPVEEWDDDLREQLGRTRIFARLEPKQKLDLVALAQQRGAVVGMTGDGVNDAPALKAADIGIAMGMQGTQVARDAADIILQDDAFETIVEAIREGRTIFTNITRFVVYLLSGNLGEILAVTAAALTNSPLPLLPLQILFINLVSDVFPAAALGVVKGDDSVLDRKPRDPNTPIMDRSRWLQTGAWALLVAVATLGTFAYALGPAGYEVEAAVTVSFMAFVIARLVHTFNMRGPEQPARVLFTSKPVWAATAVSTALLLAGLYVPALAGVLEVVTPTAGMWGLAAVGGLSVLVVGQAALAVIGIRQRR